MENCGRVSDSFSCVGKSNRMIGIKRGLWMLVVMSAALTMLASPRSAQASCGDYVQVGSHTPMSQAHEPMSAGGESQNRDAHPIHRPCSGPRCSENHKPLTPPPAAPPISVEEERWVQFALVDLSAGTASFLLPLELIALHPQHHQRSVYHPPR